MRDYKYAIYIGRFQPLHDGHMEVIRNGLEIADEVIVVVGSMGSAPNVRNPWPFEDRRRMIQESVFEDRRRVHIVGVRDYYYNENTWITNVQAEVAEIVDDTDAVALLGSYKDASSYYLKYFPDWTFETVDTARHNGTDIRDSLFGWNFLPDWEGKAPERLRLSICTELEDMPLPGPVKTFLGDFVDTKTYADMCREHTFIKEYHHQWDGAPFPPTFVTTDAVVVQSGHVLVVKRKFNPGRGLYALPGGFIKQNQRIKDSMLRELKEETRIAVDRVILESQIVAERVFDHPERSLRGRTITHGYYIKLNDGPLPAVRPDDDAERAFWMPLMDVVKYEDLFFEDHAHIINYFTGLS